MELPALAASVAFFTVYGVWTFCQDVSRLARRKRGR